MHTVLDPTAVCASSQEGQFRLTSSEGRVEVCMDGHWERVCSSCQESTAGIVNNWQQSYPEWVTQDCATIHILLLNDREACLIGHVRK